MFKKILIVLIMFLVFGCARDEETVIEDEIEYVDPVKDVFIFGELNKDLQKSIKSANNNSEYKNYLFGMLFKDVYDKDIEDIYGNTINFTDYDKLIVEVVSVECSHCKKQNESIDDFLKYADTTFIQYFNVGDKDEIIEFYGDNEIPDNIIIISRDEDLKDYFLSDIGLKMYPSLVTFNNGKVAFVSEGESDLIAFRNINEISFEKPLSEEDFIVDGVNLLTMNRSRDDVKNQLSIENQEKVVALDNDLYTEELTYTVMGQKLDFSDLDGKKDSTYYSEIDDYSYYEDKELVLFYTYLRDNSETDKVKFINELIETDDSKEYVVVLIEGLESSSAALRNMNIRFGCPVVSNLGYIPEDFFRYGISSYPTALFVNKSTFTGGYSNIESADKFIEATDIFLGDNCVAYKSNN